MLHEKIEEVDILDLLIHDFNIVLKFDVSDPRIALETLREFERLKYSI